MDNRIPFVDLKAQHDAVRKEIDAAIDDILNSSSFIGGRYVADFETQFADYLGAGEVVGAANGTDALWLALAAAGVGPGDAVITVPNTFIATVEAITRTGAYPLFVDIDISTSNLDPKRLREFLENECIRTENGQVVHPKSGRRVAAVLPVHLYGLPADLTSLLEITREFGLLLIEDACQAHGARYRVDGEWKSAGAFGTAAGFSFYPGKNLGAIGDAGAVATNDPEMAEKMRWLRNHGSSEKYIHPISDGWNSRLDAVQAAVLSIKLKHLAEWNECRRQAAQAYRQVLAGLPIELPVESEQTEPVYHLYVIRAPDRETLRQELSTRGIETGIHYPIPLHLQQAYQWLHHSSGDFPEAERSAETVLSLPMHPFLTPGQVEQVGKACADILTSHPVLDT